MGVRKITRGSKIAKTKLIKKGIDSVDIEIIIKSAAGSNIGGINSMEFDNADFVWADLQMGKSTAPVIYDEWGRSLIVLSLKIQRRNRVHPHIPAFHSVMRSHGAG